METALSYAYYQTQTIFVRQYVNNPDEKGPELVSELGGVCTTWAAQQPPFHRDLWGRRLDGRVFGQLKVVGMQGDNRALLLGH